MLTNVLQVTHLVVLTQSAPISSGDPGAAVLVASLLPLGKAGSWEVQVICAAQVISSGSLPWVVFDGQHTAHIHSLSFAALQMLMNA